MLKFAVLGSVHFETIHGHGGSNPYSQVIKTNKLLPKNNEYLIQLFTWTSGQIAFYMGGSTDRLLTETIVNFVQPLPPEQEWTSYLLLAEFTFS